MHDLWHYGQDLPEKNGMYLVYMEDHYALLDFTDGKWLPNDCSWFRAINYESSYTALGSVSTDIQAWCHIPKIDKRFI